jgi:hypothetical protein
MFNRCQPNLNLYLMCIRLNTFTAHECYNIFSGALNINTADRPRKFYNMFNVFPHTKCYRHPISTYGDETCRQKRQDPPITCSFYGLVLTPLVSSENPISSDLIIISQSVTNFVWGRNLQVVKHTPKRSC